MRLFNHRYKVKWSTALNAFVVVAEIVSGACKSRSSGRVCSQAIPSASHQLLKYSLLVGALTLAFYARPLAANPSGFHSVYGQTEVSVSGNTTLVQQSSDKAIVNWDSFNINANEHVSIIQPQGGIALYRVIGQDASRILGSLSATGSLFLVNQNGIYFGRNAQVDVGSIVASTLNINDADFLNANYRFSGTSTHAVENLGIIKTQDEGYIVLLANTVSNDGHLTAQQGSVALAAGNEAYLDFFGNGLVKTKLTGDAVHAAVNQSGTIQADGGNVQLATSARAAAINMQGVIQANSLAERDGSIVLEGGDHAQVAVGGEMHANGAQGGTIAVTGEQVALFNGTHIDVSGTKAGGHLFIGGGFQGKQADLYNARTTFVGEQVTLNASAGDIGSGGQVVVWADGSTKFFGNIIATGGHLQGAGGFAEVSGKQSLHFAGHVDVGATNGKAGTLLLDPTNINLVSGASANTTGFNAGVDQTEAYTDDSGLDSTFNVAAGGSFAGVAAGSTIVLQATNNINVNALFDVNTATGKSNVNLEMYAGNHITIAPGASMNASASGTLTLMADTSAGNTHDGAGDLIINGNIKYGSGALTLYGANIKSTNNANILAGFHLTQGGTIGALSATTASTGSFNLGSGSITTVLAGANANHGGSVTINAGAIVVNAINTSGSLSNTNTVTQNGGNAGNLSLTATNGSVSVSNLSANGSNAYGAAPGKAGNISISATNGITTSSISMLGGNALASSGVPSNTLAGGSAASLTISNTTAGNVSLGAVSNQAGANGIASTGSPSAGSVTVSNTVGNVTVTSINTAGNINTVGGNVSVTATGAVNIATINTSGGTAVNIAGPKNAGTITLSGSAITTTQLTATGGAAASGNTNGGAGGAVNLTASTSTGIQFNSMNSSGGNKSGTGTGGTGGAVTLNGSAYADGVSSAITALSGNAGSSGTGGAITFNGTLNSASANYSDLTLNTNGKTVFTQNVGTLKQLNALTTDALGSTEVNGVNFVTTLKDQTYNDALTVKTVGPTFRTTANGNVFINGTLNSNSTACCVTVNFNVGGGIYLNSAVGNVSQLYSLNTGSMGTTYIANGLAIKTQLAQTYGNNVIFAGDASISSAQGGAITFANTVTSPGTLTVSSQAGSFSATNTNNDFNSINFTTAGNVNVYDKNALSLSAAAANGYFRVNTVNDLNVIGDIRTINSSFDTSLTSGNGNIVLAANLIANKNSSINLNSTNLIRNAGNITTNGGNVSIVAQNQVSFLGSISTSGTLDTTTGVSADGGHVHIDAQDINLAAITTKSNTSSATLAGVKAGDSGNVNINATGMVVTGAINTAGANTASDNSTVGKGGAVTINAINGVSLGAITSGGGAANGLSSITQNGGDVSISNHGTGAISLSTVNTANSTGTSNNYTAVRSGNVSIVNTAGDITLTGATTAYGGKNAAGGDVSIQASGIIIANSINSAGATVTDGSGMRGGNITLSAGNKITVSSLSANGSQANGADGNGGLGGSIVVSAAQIYGTTMRTYGGNATGTGAGGNGGDITVNGDFFISSNTDINSNAGTGAISATAGLISIHGDINTANANNYQLAFNTSGIINIDGSIGNLDPIYRLTTNTGSMLNLGGETFYVDGLVALNGGLTLSAPTVEVSTFGIDHFTVSGVVDAKNTVVNANVGARSFTANNLQNDFKEVNFTNAGTVTLNDQNDLNFSARNANAITVIAACNLQTSGEITSNATSGSVRLYAGNDLNIAHAVSVHGSSNLILRSDVNYDPVLAPMNGVGDTHITANVSADNGQINAGGANLYQSQGVVSTQGGLVATYANNISLASFTAGGNVQLTAQSGNMTASGSVSDAASALLLSGKDIQLTGEYASTAVVDATGTAAVQGIFHQGLTITSTGDTALTDTTVSGLLDIHSAGQAQILNSTLEEVTVHAAMDLNYQATASGNVVLTGEQNVTLAGSALSWYATSQQDLRLAGDVISHAASETAIVLTVGGNVENIDNHALQADNAGHWKIYADHRQDQQFGRAINASYDFIDYGKSPGDTLSSNQNGLIFSEQPEVVMTFAGNINKVYDGNNQLPATPYQHTTTGIFNGDSITSATVDVHYDSPTIGSKVVELSYTPMGFVTDTGKPVFGYRYSVFNHLSGDIVPPINHAEPTTVMPLTDFYINPYLHHGFTSTITANGASGGYSLQPPFFAGRLSYHEDELTRLTSRWRQQEK